MEILNMLVLSTVHMSAKTAEDWMPNCPWACYDRPDIGWFMYVCDDVGITEAPDVPLEIRSAIHVAKRARCEWIMWDCDAVPLDELPQFDWGAATSGPYFAEDPKWRKHVDRVRPEITVATTEGENP